MHQLGIVPYPLDDGKIRKGTIKQSSATAAYKRGIGLYFKKDDPTSALIYLMKTAKAGYTKAYGEIGIIFQKQMGIGPSKQSQLAGL